jgi:hypothetical protein
MSTDTVFDLTAAIVVFGSFLGAVYFREIWKMTRKATDQPAKGSEPPSEQF